MIIFDLDYREGILQTEKYWGGAFDASILDEKKKEIFNDLNNIRVGFSQAFISGMSNGATDASTNGSTVAETMVNNGAGITSIAQSRVSSFATDIIS